MPKTPKGKKKRSKSKSEKRRKKVKRLKFDEDASKAVDSENEELECVKDKFDSDDEEGGRDLEMILEEHADKNNLSAINVKSILHHVITDRRVLELVQKVIAEKEREQLGETDDVNIGFEPKMTRSKYKQKSLEDPIAQLTKSPLKSKRPVSTFTDLEFPESSSDEEYSPDEDEEDEDTESCLSTQSDLASPYKPATPDIVLSSSFPDTSASQISFPSVSRPLTRHRSQEMTFKKPGSSSYEQTADELDDDLIAKRTRSHLPLNDKELRYDIELPDFSPDLYDEIKLDDLDDDQIAFQKFLQSLANGVDNDIMTEDDDCEYDFMAENVDNVEEKEEYRNDRAVRIPKKEVSDLFAELLNECNENEDDDTLWSTRSLLLDIEDGDASEDVVLFTDEQRAQLSKQMIQHVQLLVQVYLLSREEPSLQDEADMCCQFVNELQGFCDRSLSVHPIMALGGTMPAMSMFDVPGIQEAARIANEPFNNMKRPRSPRKQAPIKETKDGKDTKNKAPRVTLLPVSSTNQALMANSMLFNDVILLPRCGFMDKEFFGIKEPSSLRVKFTETEDNLLAIGMKQFHRNWKLIQAHLLPIKTPKQLQIRCKNLLSARAADNIVKHLRDTKTLWELPTEIKINSEADNNRRFSKHPEPNWLINYQQKMKPQKKQIPPLPSPRKPSPSIPQKIQPTAAAVQAPSNMAGSSDIENPSKQTALCKDMGDASQVDILNSHSKEDVSAITSILSPEQGKDESVFTCSIINEVVLEQNHTSVIDTSLSWSNKPTGSIPSITVQSKEEAEDPDESKSKFIDQIDNDDSQNSPNFELDGEEDAAPFTPTSCNDKDDVTLLEYSPAPSESTTDKASKSSPGTSATKGKSGRDKPSGLALISQSTTKKINYQTLPTLPPDPKEQTRAQSLANNYLEKVKKSLLEDQELYEEFLGTLVDSSTHQWTPVQLYKRMEIVLSDYPELIEDFVAFLEPEQALQAGVLMENLEFIKARNFLRRLEVHFNKNRSHFQKIIEVFSTWNSGEKTPLELHETIIPLLRGQQHLIDEFQSFFDNLKPPACSDEDFEEVEIGSGSDPEVDDFEEVIIPDIIEPRKPKGKIKVKLTPTTASKTASSNKQKPNPKPLTRTKNAKTDKRRNLVSKKSPQSFGSASRDGFSEGEEETSNDKKTLDHTNNQRPEERTDGDNLIIEQNPSSVKTEWSVSDGPLSVSSSFHNDTSNDSLRQEDQGFALKPRRSRRTSHDADDDDINDDIIDDNANFDDSNYEDCNDENVNNENVNYDDDDDANEDDANDDDSDNSDDIDESAYDGDDIEDGPEFQQRTLSAQNHELDQDGQLVVLWTRDDDRTILSICHHKGASPNTFQELATKLQGKTASEIQSRFEELMKLYEADNAREGSSSEDEADDDDSDGSDVETDL